MRYSGEWKQSSEITRLGKLTNEILALIQGFIWVLLLIPEWMVHEFLAGWWIANSGSTSSRIVRSPSARLLNIHVGITVKNLPDNGAVKRRQHLHCVERWHRLTDVFVMPSPDINNGKHKDQAISATNWPYRSPDLDVLPLRSRAANIQAVEIDSERS